MTSERLVITGCGIVGPAGQGTEALWNALAAGRACSKNSPAVPLAGRLPLDIESRLRWPDQRVASLMLLAAQEAISQAGWPAVTLSDVTTGLCAATSKGDISTLIEHRSRLVSAAPPPAEPGKSAYCCNTAIHAGGGHAPQDFLAGLPDGPGRLVGETLGHRGPRICSVAACATGTHAVIRAAQFIRDGDAHRVLVVVGDASLCPLLTAAFANMGVLTRDACRPFDRERSGFFISEGAAAVTLERADKALNEPVAELAGWQLAADPTGLTAQDATGQTLAEAIRRLLTRAGLTPGDVALYSAHGTATASNDLAEARALAAVFGAAGGHVRVMAAKSVVGHLLGSAGLTEAVLAMQAVKLGILPPIPMLRDLDPQCQIRFASTATSADLPVAVTASLGFGSQLGLLAIRR